MSDYFILKDSKLVPASLHEWAEWFEKKDRCIRQEHVGKHWVSTVCLGLGYGFGGPPKFFETMVFCDGEDQDTRRYATLEEAIQGHEEIVDELKKQENREHD